MGTFKRNDLRTLIAICSYGASLAVAPAAFAATGVLDEVIVEAQKKIETVTETPIAIQAVTGDQLSKLAGFTFSDLARTTPGLNMSLGVNSDIRLRGISTVTLAAVSLRTNVYIDGALVDNPRAVLDSQFDIQRFEILKGPQGTLYGASSPTGTINVRSQNPNLSAVDGYVQGSVGNNDFFNGQFGISLPIIENELAVRIAGLYNDGHPSGVKNITTGTDAINRGSGTRITVLWEPNDAFSARLSHLYREGKLNPFYNVDGGGLNYDDDKLHSSVDDLNTYREKLTTFELNYALNDHLTVTSVTGYEEQKFYNMQDMDGLPNLTNPDFAGLTPWAPLGYTQATNIPLRGIQEDLRLASEDNDFWDWQLGFFYKKSNTNTTVDSRQAATVGLGTVGLNQIFAGLRSSQESYAVYTHNTFKLTDSLNLIAGLRYQQARSSNIAPFSGKNYTYVPFTGQLFETPFAAPDSETRKTYYPVTGTVKLQYFFNPDVMAYVTLDRANRNGSSNLDLAGNLPKSLIGIDSEPASSIEAGIKGNFGDQRGRFAVTLYDQKYKGFQQDFNNMPVYLTQAGVDLINSTTTGTLNNVVQNAKEAETRGAEFNIAWLWVDNWNTELNLAYTDSKFTDFKEAIGNIGNCPGATEVRGAVGTYGYYACDLTGERLPLYSRWSGNVTSNFSLPAFDGTDWYFNALLNFQSNQIDKVTRDTLGGYYTVDLFTGFRASEGNAWDVSLWAKNVLDRRAITANFRPGVTNNNVDFDMVTVNLPRQVGVTGTYRF